MPRLHLDIETYSEVDLKTAGVYAYTQHPSFQILMCAWSYDGSPVEVELDEEGIDQIPGLWDEDVIKVAHNAPFERVCFSQFGRDRAEAFGYGDQVDKGFLPNEQWHDTLAVAGELGYPLGLGDLAHWLGGEQKDSAGTALVNFFCKPYKGKRRLPQDHPEKWAQFVEYCRQDVVTLIDVDERLGDFPTPHERQVWDVDQAINDYGVRIDLDLAHTASAAAQSNAIRDSAEFTEVTGVLNPASNPQLAAWRKAQAIPGLVDFKAATVTKTLARTDLKPEQRRALELRQELALVAAQKYAAAIKGVSHDGRLRGQFRFFGAHTGRWAGRGVQLHNMPREHLSSDAEVDASILDLALGLGADPVVLKALVRPMLLGPLTVADYAAIEARVIAWLAGEEWALQAFRDRRDIYVETAERMSTKSTKLDRAQGKVAVLALGFNGGVNSLVAMGAEGSDAQLQMLVTQWRAANPNIVDLWQGMGEAFRVGGPVGDGHLNIVVDGTDRAIELPSGRSIVYHHVQHKWEDTRYGRRLSASFADPRKVGVRTRTYGGKLSENVTQAIGRDLLAAALVRAWERGYKPVGHVHDEILFEGAHDVRVITDLMSESPTWAAGLPIAAEGFVCPRYRKG